MNYHYSFWVCDKENNTMPEFTIDYNLNVYGDRNKVRMTVVNELS